MKAFWAGAVTAPSTASTNFASVTACNQGAWTATEANRTIPLSDAITVTAFRAWVETAPGAGNSYAFTIRANGADTAATVTISESETSASWSGSLALSQLDEVCIESTPTSTPTAPGRVYWIIEYTTSGNFYLLPNCTGDAQNSDATLSFIPFGGNNYVPSGSSRAVPIPACTVTKLAGAVTGGSNNSYHVRKNGVTQFSTTGISTTPQVNSGTATFAAGDLLDIAQTDSGSSWARHASCLTIEPVTPGEIIMGYDSSAAAPTGATEYEMPQGLGDNDWDATESNVYMRLPSCTLRNLYVVLSAAPSSGDARSFTLRSNLADTSVVASISDANTTGNSGGNSAVHTGDNFVSIKASVTGAPASSGVSFGFIAYVPQGGANHRFFAAL